ncbi:hypothetical protein PMIN06_005516 [Paraphaeosphaeria minitans]
MPDVLGQFEHIANEGSQFCSLRKISDAIRTASDSLASEMSLDDSILGGGRSEEEEDVDEAAENLVRLTKEFDVMKLIQNLIKEQKVLLYEAVKEGGGEKGMVSFVEHTLKALSRMEDEVMKAGYENHVQQSRCTAQLSKKKGHVLTTGYLSATADKFQPIKGAQFEMKPSGGSKKNDQDSFKERLRKAYRNPLDYEECWDPVLGRWQTSHLLTATHIVPYAMGEDHAAYIFGVHPTKGYEIIWGLDNGLLLHPSTEHAMDEGGLVIVPDPSNPESWKKQLRAVVLDEALKSKPLDKLNPRLGTYGNLHMRKLTWSDAISTRPRRRFLYFFFLMTLFRRRRYNVAGWEKDRDVSPHDVDDPG